MSDNPDMLPEKKTKWFIFACDYKEPSKFHIWTRALNNYLSVTNALVTLMLYYQVTKLDALKKSFLFSRVLML